MSAANLRVALVLGLPYPKTAGGAERWMHETGRALALRVSVTAHYMSRPGREPLAPDGFDRLHPFHAPPLAESDRLSVSLALLRATAGADVVHICQYGAVSTHLLALRRRLRGRSVFVTDLGSNGVPLGARLGLHALFSGFLEISHFATRDRPADRTRVVWGGVDADRYRPGPKDAEPFALFVGRLLPHKGVDVLIEALPAGRRLVIAGRSHESHREYLALLRQMAEGKDVRFILDPDDAELARLYAAATVTVLPSVWVDVFGTRHRVPELLGLTLLESLASGTPVIASNVAALPEVVHDGDTGRVVPPGDTVALGHALEERLSDPAGSAVAGHRGRQDVLDRFTWDRVADRCLEAYAELGSTKSSTAWPARTPP